MCISAGGVPIIVKLNEDDWSIPHAELEAAFSPRTKFVLVNTPHNPTGKVFSKEDLSFLASLCQKWGTYAVLDEVGAIRSKLRTPASNDLLSPPTTLMSQTP